VGSRFTIRAEGPGYSRQIVRSALIGERGEAIEDAALLTSELVADVMARGSEDPDLFVDVRKGHLHVAVYGTGTSVSLGIDDEADERSGVLHDVRRSRLRIVDALSSAWGHESRLDVDALWFDLDL